MSKLFVFGDSFSEGFENFYDSTGYYVSRHEYIHKFLNGEIPKTYGKIIADKLGFEFVNRAALNGFEGQANCNDSIFNNFCLSSPEMNQGDIVIYQYTSIERIKWCVDKNLMTILPNEHHPNLPKEENDAISQYLVNRDKSAWINEFRIKEVLMKEFCKSKGVKIFFWCQPQKFHELNYSYLKNENSWLLNNVLKRSENINHIIKLNGGKTIKEETNEIIKDDHYGKTGHEILSELFYVDIFEKINNI